MTVTM